MRKALSKLILLFVFTSMLIPLSGVSFSRASGSIYIWPGGEVYPSDAPIERVGNVYTLTDDINDSIVVQRDNIVLDGIGLYTLQGPGDINSIGVDLTQRINVTVRGLVVRGFGCGILLNRSTNNVISENTLMFNNRGGIHLADSSENSISGNTMTTNMNYDVELYGSSNNSVYNNDLRRILLTYSSTYNNVFDNCISNSGQEGIGLIWSSDNNIIHGNNLTAGGIYGIHCVYSSGQLIISNNIKERDYGIHLSSSSNNTVAANTIENNNIGIWLDDCSYNKIFHNNLLDNMHDALTFGSEINLWDGDYSSEGNYWSNYTGADLDGDGIGDSSYVIDANNRDNYPLMGLFSDFKPTSEYHVQTICNSTITGFQFNGTAINFNVIGEDGTTGFCRILIPTALMNEPYRVLVNATEILPSPEPLPFSNSTHNYVYFTYSHSTQEVIIIPEFPIWRSMLLILVIFTVTVASYKRRLLKTPIH